MQDDGEFAWVLRDNRDEMMEELRLPAMDEMRTLSGQATDFVARRLGRWREDRGKRKKDVET